MVGCIIPFPFCVFCVFAFLHLFLFFDGHPRKSCRRFTPFMLPRLTFVAVVVVVVCVYKHTFHFYESLTIVIFFVLSIKSISRKSSRTARR